LVLLAGLALGLGPGGDFASLASDGAGSYVIRSPSALEVDFVPAGDADWQTVPSVEHTQYGQSVASAGDVDNYWGDDVLIGAPKDATVDGSGAVYLYLSTGSGLNTTYAWAAGGGSDAVSFGSAVAGAGDVNDDGIDDAIIADDEYKALLEINGDQKLTKAGGAFVYKGIAGVGLSDEPIWSYTGAVQAGKFASAVTGAGDLNDDGIDDIVVGAQLYTDRTDNTENSEGAFYVFFGHEDSGPSADWDWLIDSDQPGALLGWSLSAAGDVNHDGYDDFLVGAPGALNLEGVRAGAVFLFLGGTMPDDVADAAWVAYGDQEDAWFGYSVAGRVDVNGDGLPDVVVSTPYHHRPSDDAQAGAAFAYCGNGSTLGSDPCWTVYGGQPGGQFGYSVAGAGDVNADGYDDVIVGAPTYLPDPDTGFEGAAFVYFGSGSGLSPLSGWKTGGDKARTDFGWSVGSAGDVNSNSSDGVLIGAPSYRVFEMGYGAAFAFCGPLEPADLDPVYLPLVMRGAD
jgi:hypothetical protein